jgi:uncharacterized protein YutE (UPF0331/DUF86 family)
MAAADLDVVIRRNAKEQHKLLMDAAKQRRDHFLALAAKAKDKAGRDRHKQAAKDTMLQGTAIARRLQMSAENAADSYARSIKKAATETVKPAKAADNKTADNKTGKKAAGKTKG